MFVCVLWSVTSGCVALTFTPGKEPDAIIYPPLPPSPHPFQQSCSSPDVKAGICHLHLNLNQRHYLFYLISFFPSL